MKKFFILSLFVFLASAVSAQSCLPDGIAFITQEQIDSFQSDYPGCTEIEGNVTIQGANINSLEGLNVVTSIGGFLTIFNNDALTSLEGLDNLETVDGEIIIAFHDLLTSLSGLDNLSTIGSSLEIYDNKALTSMDGLQSLNEIPDQLYIGFNNALEDLSGLNNLTSIGGYLEIESNSLLESLSSLQNLTSLGGYLEIELHPALTSLEGLDNIDAGSIQNLYIVDNAQLATCEVESVCNYLAAPTGDAIIENNAEGCSNREEVEAACEVVNVNEFSQTQELVVKCSPSPFTLSTRIEFDLDQARKVSITFFNQFGEQVDAIEQQQPAGKQQFTWSPNLPAGIYYFRLQAGEQVASGKVVKVGK